MMARLGQEPGGISGIGPAAGARARVSASAMASLIFFGMAASPSTGAVSISAPMRAKGRMKAWIQP
ncbi:hypothetical protein J2T31_001790 [Kerstersia gyiorum]|nr:hypothetical protein [Kerstersia gyiorum]MCP1823563.1 hypothetical protein [Kerstersia gyiorum]MCW2451057.1 hypothetical protein [Kerstersia gyiorum]